MKCGICKKRTTENTSYGRPSFLVCHECYKKLRKTGSALDTIDKICDIGIEIADLERRVFYFYECNTTWTGGKNDRKRIP